MVAINEILLPECTGGECGGDNEICTDSRVHHRNAENRAPVTRNHRSAPILGRWLTRDPIGYQGGINLYGYVNSSPVGNVDAEGLEAPINARPLGSGVSGSSIKLSLQAREYDPTCTYGPVVARLKMHLRFEYNPGGKVPTVTTDSGKITTVGGWGGVKSGSSPTVSPIPATIDGYVGVVVKWRPVVTRDSSGLVVWTSAIGWGILGAAVAFPFSPVGALVAGGAGGVAGYVDGELSSPSYTVRVSGEWFVWQSDHSCKVHIVSLNGQVDASATSPLPAESVVVESAR